MEMKKPHTYPTGTKRVKSKNFKQYKKKDTKWIETKDMLDSTKNIIKAYIKHKTTKHLIDNIKKEFLKGHLNPEGHILGSRITILPNGKKLARAGFSIFAKNLTLNKDNKTEWDVHYENASGTITYLYSEEKVHLEQKQKAKIVDAFAKCYSNILKQTEKDLGKIEVLALYTLLKTYIRVGNLEYYHHLGHKGLTTLQKEDININKNNVTFTFIGKDGVPQKITKQFPKKYVEKLKKHMQTKKDKEFIFTDKKNIPLHGPIFTNLLFKYTGEHFYPHIIRSHYADTECEKFLKGKKKRTKEEAENKLFEIALNLGHKKYNKKKNKWEPNYTVTLTNYIRPEYGKKMINFSKYSTLKVKTKK